MTSPHTAGRTESPVLDQQRAHYAGVKARLYGRKRLVRRVVPTLPIQGGRSLDEVTELPVAVTPTPLNMLAYPSWRFLVAYAAAKHGVDREYIVGPRRAYAIVAASDEAIYLSRTHVPGLGLTRLGIYFQRDHTSVLQAVRRYIARKGSGRLSPLSTEFTGSQPDALTDGRISMSGRFDVVIKEITSTEAGASHG